MKPKDNNQLSDIYSKQVSKKPVVLEPAAFQQTTQRSSIQEMYAQKNAAKQQLNEMPLTLRRGGKDKLEGDKATRFASYGRGKDTVEGHPAFAEKDFPAWISDGGNYQKVMDNFRMVPEPVRSGLMAVIIDACGKRLVDAIEANGGSINTPKGEEEDTAQGVGLFVAKYLKDVITTDPIVAEIMRRYTEQTGKTLSLTKIVDHNHMEHLGRQVAYALGTEYSAKSGKDPRGGVLDYMAPPRKVTDKATGEKVRPSGPTNHGGTSVDAGGFSDLF